MVQVVCDSCGKTLKNPAVDTNYVYRLGRHICMSCHEKLVAAVDKSVEAKAPYTYRKYWTVYEDTVKKMCR
jgi:hypothetical protein